MTRQELIQRLARPLQRELATGCTDRVVAGGLEKLVHNLARPFPEVTRLLEGYAALEPEARCARLREALARLGVEGASAQAPQKPQPAATGPPATELDAPVDSIPLGPKGAQKMRSLGVRTLRDLLFYYPRRHEDRRTLPGFAALAPGAKATVVATVLSKSQVKTPRKKMLITQARLADEYGHKLTAVWFNQPWVMGQLREGEKIVVTGRYTVRGRVRNLAVEYFEAEGGEQLSTGRIVPVYSLGERMSQAWLRRSVWRALEAVKEIPDPLPEELRQKLGLADLDFALRQIHFPESEQHLARALERLKFDEFFFLELRVLLTSGASALVGQIFEVRKEDLQTFLNSLPFQLTPAQRRALDEILADMQNERQMARLLQGDVGSGKTVVAAAALYVAAKNQKQGALMAPTEILAKQHFENLARYLWPLGVRVELLTGSMKASEKKRVYERIESGEVDVVVGTHALIQKEVRFRELGLAVIDEEHRFGVMQRRALLQGRPDVLVMTATPIPRSLALTLYGDLEVSIIDEMPPGRKPVKTRLLTEKSRKHAYAFARKLIAGGHQVFVVAPLIEESDAEVMAEVRAATELAAEVAAMLPEARVEVLHGRMKAEEKDALMERFRNRDFDVLVSTTVIEVGVDIPGANLMIIENAERFGLAQLHQLRGRVGRGGEQAYCILIAGDTSRKTMQRLRVIEKSTDGFYVAEQDLKLRGPGELRGTRQSGLPDLQLGDLTSDVEIIESARSAAKQILDADPYLTAPEHQALRRELQLRGEAVGLREII
ncbi:ATP-dependent DNA helicase RecG [Oceanithermus sp.]